MDARTVEAPMVGTVAHVQVEVGGEVRRGGTLLALESMKMEHPVVSPDDGTVVAVLVAPGDTVRPGDPLVRVANRSAAEPGDDVPADGPTPAATSGHLDPEAASSWPEAGPLRADLAEVFERRARLEDAARPEATRARHERGRRTARENVADLVDDGSFVEYGGLAIAAQRARRSLDELIATTPADGLITGTATVNAEEFGVERARCVVLADDATVLAGTQGAVNHRKKDRMLALAARHRLPVVVFAEGGGGRPGDTDVTGASWLDVEAFHLFARLSGSVPTVAIIDGYCFAGNAALAGAADVIIATEGANLGMAGPAMIEGGGLGVHHPPTIGPIEVLGVGRRQGRPGLPRCRWRAHRRAPHPGLARQPRLADGALRGGPRACWRRPRRRPAGGARHRRDRVDRRRGDPRGLAQLYDTDNRDEGFAQTYCPPNWEKWLETVQWVIDDI